MGKILSFPGRRKAPASSDFTRQIDNQVAALLRSLDPENRLAQETVAFAHAVQAAAAGCGRNPERRLEEIAAMCDGFIEKTRKEIPL